MRSFISVVSALTILALSLTVPSYADGYVAHTLSSWGQGAYAWDINDFGRVVGQAYSSTGNVVLWNSIASEPQVLATGNNGAEAFINDSGTAVLRQSDANGYYMFTWNAATGLSRLNTPGFSSPEGINVNGIIVGNTWGGEGATQAFVIDKAGSISYIENAFGGMHNRATGINDADYVAGYASTSGGLSRAYIWHGGETTDLGTFGGTWSEALAVNNAGQVVGVYGGSEGYSGWFVWSPGSQPVLISDNSLFDEHEVFIPLGINDTGLVVGNVRVGGEDTVVTWNLGGGFSIVGTGEAHAINNSGYIAGMSEGQAVVWEPVPEPSSLLALAGGITCLGTAIRRRRLW